MIDFGTSKVPINGLGRVGSRLIRRPALKVYLSRSSQMVCCADGNKLQVVFVSTEVAPWSKTGGLGDVAASLPAALAARGHQVMTVCPRYAEYPGVFDTGLVAPVELSGDGDVHETESRSLEWQSDRQSTIVSSARYYACHDRGVLRVFVDHPVFGLKRSKGICGAQSDIVDDHHKGFNQVSSNSLAEINGVRCNKSFSESLRCPPILNGGTIGYPLPNLGVYTYSDGEGLSDVDLQARNNVLCQAALAAPVLLWQKKETLTQRLQDANRRIVTREALPLVLKNGIAKPAITVGSRVTEGLQVSLGFHQLVKLPFSTLSCVYGLSGTPDVTAVLAGCGDSNPCSESQQFGRAGPDQVTKDELGPHNEVLFVGNDWPSGLMPLWLKTYREALVPSTSVCKAGLMRQQSKRMSEPEEPTAGPVGSIVSLDATEFEAAPTYWGCIDEKSAACSSGSSVQTVDNHNTGGGLRYTPEDVNQVYSRSSDAYSTPEALLADAPCRVTFSERNMKLHFTNRLEDDAHRCAGKTSRASAVLLSATQQRVRTPQDDIDCGRDAALDNSSPCGRSCVCSSISSMGNKSSRTLKGRFGHCSMCLSAPRRYDSATMQEMKVLTRSSRDEGPGPYAGLIEEEVVRQEVLLMQLLDALKPETLPCPAEEMSSYAASFHGKGLGSEMDRCRLEGPPPGLLSARHEQSGHQSRDVQGNSQAHMRRTLHAFRSFIASRLDGAKVVLAVHNFAFQGLFPAGSFSRLGLPLFALQQMIIQPNSCTTDISSYIRGCNFKANEDCPTSASEGESADGAGTDTSCSLQYISWLKGALLSSDLLVTVSPGYAREVMGNMAAAWPSCDAGQHQPALPVDGVFGDVMNNAPGLPHGASTLCGIVASRGVHAILNGLDVSLWNPSLDPLLPVELRYSREEVCGGKARAKARLQAVLGLEVDPCTPLFGFVGRLEQQKGVDVILAAVPQLLGPHHMNGTFNRSLNYNPKTSDCAARQALLKSAEQKSSQALRSFLQSLCTEQLSSEQLSEQSRLEAAQPHASVEGSELQKAGGLRSRVTEHSQANGGSGVMGLGEQHIHLQLAMLGVGQQWLQDGLAALPRTYPGRAAAYVGFDESLCHLLMAGCDFLLVPSRWEPCGLVAMAALRYGTVPVVAPTGGLLDAVAPCVHTSEPIPLHEQETSSQPCDSLYNSNKPSLVTAAETSEPKLLQNLRCNVESVGNLTSSHLGIVMDEIVGDYKDSFAMRKAVESLVRAIKLACSMYGTAAHNVLRDRCMTRDVSWDASAHLWEKMLHDLARGMETRIEA
ncbi:hypothetical protein Vretimale_2959 [Volvox reticuliferus]|uniref:Starch synthase catalytic domain-containing protein n=1 Tax=Volvox reticuliferus TaxID=1737510 RepID=A0A8J4D8I3_9CHLO|nr:hypothetical protein Vretifemale_6917 [Volvox reticuliferus]GIL97222.1 hypothetical protein Vretimale_2959 [Volvox reticuliferus]